MSATVRRSCCCTVSAAADGCGFTRSGRCEDRFRVIAYDQRGHGLTDAPAVATEYSAAHLARDLVGVLDALKIERAAIVGFSLGGGPALASCGQQTGARVPAGAR